MGTKIIITTVGTSLRTNFKEKYPDKKLSALDDKEEREKPRSSEDYEYFKEILLEEGVYDQLKNFAIKDFPKSSAELTSLYKLKEKYPNDEFIIYLLTSDTFEGYFVGEILKEVLEHKKEDLNIRDNNDIYLNYIKGLQIKDEKILKEEGLRNLFILIDEMLSSYYLRNIIFNITGGYKGITPLITVIGEINGIPLYYTFENSETLIEIPILPLSIDWSYFTKYQFVFEDLEKCIDDWEKYKYENNIEDFNETLIEVIKENGKTLACLNQVGKYLYSKLKNSIIIRVYKHRDWLKKEKKNRKEIENVFRELYIRLVNLIKNNPNEIKNTQELIRYIKNLPDTDDLKHGGNLDKDSFIFKSTKNNQIRIVYSPIYENENLSFIVFNVLKDFNHSTYIEEVKKEMKELKFSDKDLEDYIIHKEAE